MRPGKTHNRLVFVYVDRITQRPQSFNSWELGALIKLIGEEYLVTDEKCLLSIRHDILRAADPMAEVVKIDFGG
jgi:hypothetical protein